MIVVTHHRPDGTPCAACCEFCPEDPWKPDPYWDCSQMMHSFQCYLRTHLRQRVIPPAPTLGTYIPSSRGRRDFSYLNTASYSNCY